jgi:hypothetical protein
MGRQKGNISRIGKKLTMEELLKVRRSSDGKEQHNKKKKKQGGKSSMTKKDTRQ